MELFTDMKRCDSLHIPLENTGFAYKYVRMSFDNYILVFIAFLKIHYSIINRYMNKTFQYISVIQKH